MAKLQTLLIILLYIFAIEASVTLDSSADSVCPGDTVVFTCATDTGNLLWTTVGYNGVLYHSTTTNHEQALSIFNCNLTSRTGNELVSTATVYNAHLDHNGTEISCSDDVILQTSNTSTKAVILSGLPSSPFNLTSSSTLTSITISWVAPLDTPLCVHSYTVTVRNSCNSSQVMVYNTTDNRSSLSITDLTSDGEYSVTVAGRDGAGRLGQESEELTVSLQKKIFTVINISNQCVSINKKLFGALLSWKTVPDHSAWQIKFLIYHNVTLDKSPIEINRPSVILYKVQPGETYAVNITPINCGSTKEYVFQASEPFRIPKQNCNAPSKENGLSKGYIASIVGSIVLVFVITCYLLMCVYTNFHAQSTSVDVDTNRTRSSQLDDVASINTVECKDATEDGHNLAEYDYVCLSS